MRELLFRAGLDATWLPVSKGRLKAVGIGRSSPSILTSGACCSLRHTPAVATARVPVAAHRQPGLAFVSAPSHRYKRSAQRQYAWSAAIGTAWAVRTAAGTLATAQQSSST